MSRQLSIGTGAVLNIASGAYKPIPLDGETLSYTEAGVPHRIRVSIDMNPVTDAAKISVRVKIGPTAATSKFLISHDKECTANGTDIRILTDVIELTALDDTCVIQVASDNANDDAVTCFGTVIDAEAVDIDAVDGNVLAAATLLGLIQNPITADVIKTQCDDSHDSAMPGSPTSGSINALVAEIIKLVRRP